MKSILLLMICAVLTYGCTKDNEIYPATKSDKTEIQDFKLLTGTGGNATSSVVINAELHTVTIIANSGISLSHLFPSATISEGAIVRPALGVYADFTNPVTYTVIAGNRQNEKVWTIKVTP